MKYVICDECGKEFLKKPNKIGERNFCSRECFQKDRQKKGKKSYNNEIYKKLVSFAKMKKKVKI